MDIDKILACLANTRPVFHSEADFQHAFAWEIHSMYPDALIRLEYPFKLPETLGKIWHIDIFVVVNQYRYAIELKYATARTEFVWNDEEFNLRDQSAADLVCSSYCADIQRVTHVIQAHVAAPGFDNNRDHPPNFSTLTSPSH